MQLRRINKRQHAGLATPVMAAVTSIAVVAAAAFGGNQILKTQEIGSGPIETAAAEGSFADGSTVVVNDAAIASQGEEAGAKAVKEFHRDQQFSQFALTWTGERDLAAYVRAKQADGTWSQWYQADPIGASTSGKTGTELIYVGPTNDVQVSVGNVDLVSDATASGTASATPTATTSADATPATQDNLPATENGATPIAEQAAANSNPLVDKVNQIATNVGNIKPVAESIDTSRTLPSDLGVVFIDGNVQDGIAPVAEVSTAGAPAVISRAGWGADESIRCQQPDYDGYDKALTLHHTAGSNNYTQAEAAAQVRGIYRYHAQTLGWCDVGYNVLVDKFGNIYEGRYGGLDKAVQGAHVGGFNSHNWGISMIGNYSEATPTRELLDSVSAIAGWKAAVSGFDPAGTTTLTSGGFSGSKYPAGSTYSGPAFLGHNDLHYTECPGANTMPYWPQIRAAAHAKYVAITTGAAPSAETGQSGQTSTATSPTTTAPSQKSQTTQQQTQQTQNAAVSGQGSSLGGTQISQQSIQAIVGVAAALLGIIAASGKLNLNLDQKIAGNLSLDQVPGIVSKVVSITGNSGLKDTWTTVLNGLGPVLGLAVGGPNLVDVNSQLVTQLFSNGAVLSSKDTGTHALVGEIAKKWAENPQSLGLPTSDEYSTGNGQTVRVDFQGGYITYDPATQKVELFNK